tara:strand:- start:277 stop:1680 length:1404 start_codon:yes stop_codon:yes gene_type:complete
VICFFLLGSSAKAAEKLNVLFIAADDLRADLRCMGNKEVLTPNLDALAAGGRLFNRAYCQQAVCNPSRASLMTGRRPDTLKIWDLPTHFRHRLPDVVTLPQHFMKQGYFTQNIGKIYHNWRQDKEKGDAPSWSVPAVMHYASHYHDRERVDGEKPKSISKDPKCFRKDVPDEAYFDGRIASLAIKALRERKKAAKPFFLAIGFWKPHAPFNAPSKYWDLYDRSKLSRPPNPDWPKDAPRIAWHNSREILGGGKQRKLKKKAVMELRHGYLAAITYFDAQLGKVLAELDRLGLREKTVVVFWSDHGFHLGEQALWAKTSNFELDAHVPMIISAPGMKSRGVATDSLAELLDLYPTLVEICGLPKAEGLEGQSLAPILKDPSAIVKRGAFTQHPRPAYFTGAPDVMGRSVRTARYRYTEWRDFKTGNVVASELYDHEKDPLETVNIAGLPSSTPALAECRARYREGFAP